MTNEIRKGKDIKVSEIFVGMEFTHNKLQFNEATKEWTIIPQGEISVVTKVTPTKSGKRVNVEVNGRHWGNGAISPNTMMIIER